jgi:hypothetical protein
MTVCAKQLTFSFYHDKQLVADFKGGQISSDAGLLVVRELESKLGWLGEAAARMSDPRDPNRTELDLVTLLRQRVFGMIGGYDDCNDHDRLRNDPVLKLVCDRSPREEDALASQPTLSRMENWATARDVARLSRLLVRQYIQVHKTRRPSRKDCASATRPHTAHPLRTGRAEELAASASAARHDRAPATHPYRAPAARRPGGGST